VLALVVIVVVTAVAAVAAVAVVLIVLAVVLAAVAKRRYRFIKAQDDYERPRNQALFRRYRDR
jgi:hypothetical protein